jgi:DNA-binding NtrC family response regulator
LPGPSTVSVCSQKQVIRDGGLHQHPDQPPCVILAASNEDLEVAAREGRCREDLYYRLNVVPIELPPRREREDDDLLLAEHYLRWYVSLQGVLPRQLADDAQDLFRVYPWPGDVRELRNAQGNVTRAASLLVLSCDTLRYRIAKSGLD